MTVEDVYLHIGPHKTGTTYVQRVLKRNPDALRRDGGLLPLGAYVPQRDAVEELLAVVRGIRSPRWVPDLVGTPEWDELVARTLAWQGSGGRSFAVISVEQLDRSDEAMTRVVAEAFAGTRLHVVYTARDLSLVLPALWHTRTRNGAHDSWDDFLRHLREAPDSDGWTWETEGQDPFRTLTMWAQVGAPRAHPPRDGPASRARRRTSCGVGSARCWVSTSTPTSCSRTTSTRPSVAAEVELLRRLNAASRSEISFDTYNQWVRRVVVRGTLDKRQGQQRYALGAEDHRWVREHSLAVVERLRGSGFDVVGDLQELVPSEDGPSHPSPDEVRAEDVLDVAVEALAALVIDVDRSGTPRPRPSAAGAEARARAGQGATGEVSHPTTRFPPRRRLGRMITAPVDPAQTRADQETACSSAAATRSSRSARPTSTGPGRRSPSSTTTCSAC